MIASLATVLVPLAQSGDGFVRDANAPHVAREQWTVKFPPTVVNNFNGVAGSAVKIVGVSDDHTALRLGTSDVFHNRQHSGDAGAGAGQQ